MLMILGQNDAAAHESHRLHILELHEQSRMIEAFRRNLMSS